MAPCSADAWFAAAVQLIPFESVRYQPSRRKNCVSVWVCQSKAFAIHDDMLVQVAELRPKRKPNAADELWERLKMVGSLSKEEALTIWSKSTWAIYRRTTEELGWGVKLPDGGLRWIGPADATATELHQYRRKHRAR